MWRGGRPVLLDLRRQLLVLDILAAYARDSGAVVVAVLHDLSLAARFATSMLLLREGRPVASGSPDEVLRVDTVREAYDVGSESLRSSGHPLVVPIEASRRETPTAGRRTA